MKKSTLVFLILLFLSPAAGAFTLSNFEAPESIVMDPDDGSYFISNVNGEFTAKDGNGYISKVNSQGNIVIQKFIGGKDSQLHAPKGMVLFDNNLYVVDIDAVKVFNKKSRKLIRTIDFSSHHVKALNDITVDAMGIMYVSATMSNRIFKIDTNKKDQISIFAEGKELGGPDGLIVNPKSRNLMAVTWDSGQVIEFDRWGKVHVLKRGLKNLVGIDYDAKGNLYVSSFDKGEIYRIPIMGRGSLSIYLSGLTTPADISYDREKEEILVPSMNANTVSTIYKK